MIAKIMITGCNGLLGQKLVAQFDGNFEVLGVDLGEKSVLEGENFQYLKLDITKRKEVKKAILDFKPEFIINCAAYTDVDGCERNKSLCWEVNVGGVENLIYAGKKVGAKIIHLSTDYVFNGKRGSYTEEDQPDPINYYGKSKLASENAIKASGIDYVIIRTAVLYGKAIGVAPNFVTWLLEKLRKGEKVNIVDDQFGNPTLADNLASGIRKMVSMDASGLYHLAGREVIDRYNFALKIAQIFNLDESLINRVKTDQLNQLAKRPLMAGLVVEKVQEELGVKLLNVEEGLTVLKNQIARSEEWRY